MPESYVPLLVMLAVAVAVALLFFAMAALVGPKKMTPAKAEPYECGSTPVGTARRRFGAKFYVVALLFIVFDIETVFLFPWAVLYRELGLLGLAEMGVFLGVLMLGLAYVWKKGALEWT